MIIFLYCHLIYALSVFPSAHTYTCAGIHRTSLDCLTSTCDDRSYKAGTFEVCLIIHTNVMSSFKFFFLFQIWWTHKLTSNFVTFPVLYQSVASTVCPIIAFEVTRPNQQDLTATDWFEDIKEELLCLLFLKYILHRVRWERRGGGEDSRKQEQRYHASSWLIYL